MRDDIHGLKLRIEYLEHRVTDLGAFVQAAVKELRQHAQHRTLEEEMDEMEGELKSMLEDQNDQDR